MNVEPSRGPSPAASRRQAWIKLLGGCIWCFFAVSPARALDPTLQLSQYAHTAWTAREGALKGGVLSIAQTKDGYLWLSTNFGLVRFDGVRFVEAQTPKSGTLPKPPYWKIYAARDGGLWIGSQAGLARLEHGRVTNFPQLTDGAVSAITEDRDGTIWAGTNRPNALLCSIRGDQVQCFGNDGAFGSSVGAIYVDPAGSMWVGASSGLWRWKPGPPKLYPGDAAAKALAVDEHGTILLANFLALRGLIDEKIQAYPMERRAGPINARALLTDKNGGVWIGTEGQGLVHLYHGAADTYRRQDGLSDNDVTSFFEDREGNVWAATAQGLDRFRELAIPTIGEKQGLQSEATASVIVMRDTSIWVGGPGLDRIEGMKASQFSRNRDLPDQYVSSMFEDQQGRLLISTLKGAVWLQNGKILPTSIAVEEVFSIAQDSGGRYWIADHELGLIHAGADGKVLDITPWSKFRRYAAFAVVPDSVRGGLWLGFRAGGLSLAFVKDGKILEQYGPSQGFEGQVRDVQVEANGTVWVSTEDGLGRLKDGKVAFLTKKNGLPCDSVFWARDDDAESVWLRTSCGLVRLAKAELRAWESDPARELKSIQVFDQQDGVAEQFQPGPYTPQVVKTADGRLLFTQSGVAIIDPHKLPVNSVPPPMVIEQISVDGKDYNSSSGSVAIPPLPRDLRIDYTALSFAEPGKVRFRYKLEGHDQDWQDPQTRRQAFYSDLPPGSYLFRVIAANNNGVWNELGATQAFRVEPAWYQTSWFRLLCVAAIAATLWALYQLRLQQLERRFSMRLEDRVGERTRIARELHDTLLQSFHGLLLRFQTALDLLPTRPAEAQQTLASAVKQAAQAITEGRDAVQGLRSSTNEYNDLAAAIKTLGEELAADDARLGSVNLRLSVEGTPRHLHPILRDEVYRIAAEALRNAFKHAHAQHIEAEIRYDERRLRLRIRDDGKGIDPGFLSDEGRTGHYGLHGMRERATLMGGTLAVWSALASGTEVELEIPANRAYLSIAPLRRSWLVEWLSGRRADLDETNR